MPLDLNALPPLSTSEVARLMGVTIESVRRWCKSGKIAHSRTPGGDYLIARSVVEQYLPRETAGEMESRAQRTKRASKAREAIRSL